MTKRTKVKKKTNLDLLGITNERVLALGENSLVVRLASGALACKEMIDSDLQYSCKEHFVLQYGHRWTWSPTDRPRRRENACFGNSAKLALKDDSLIYVEGFVSSIFPIHHAWCVERTTGKVVDTTIVMTDWRRKNPAEYLGIPFATEWVGKTALWHGFYGEVLKWEAETLFSGNLAPEILEKVA